MFSSRSTSRVLLTAGAAVALALVPGAALADDDPLPGVVDGTGQTLEELGDDVAAALPTPSTGTAAESSAQEGQAAESSSSAPPPGGAPAPDDLQALVDQVLTEFPQNECTDGVATALRALLAQVADPTALEEYQAALQAYLAGLGEIDPTDPSLPEPPALPEPPDPAAFQAALEDLVAALEACVPAPPSSEPPPPPSAGGDGGASPPQPVAAPAEPTPQVVSYPGYAPTGGVAEETGGPALPAAGIGLLLTGGLGAATWWRRTREARGEA